MPATDCLTKGTSGTSAGLPRLLWPYAKQSISSALAPAATIERIRAFIPYNSRIWADLHYREAKGQFAGRVKGSRFRMARVIHGEFTPVVHGRVRAGSVGETVVELQFTVGALYALPVAAVALIIHFLLTGEGGAAVFAAFVLVMFGAGIVQFWPEVGAITEELRTALKAGQDKANHVEEHPFDRGTS